MNRTYVNSSNLESAGYDSNVNVLEIEFKRGAIYHYFDVPENVFHELINASSVGSYFNHNIRDVYQCQKI